MSAFSLPDLLATAAMASLLVGILLPATTRPRISTAKLRCLDNARQLARASQMYAMENRDFLPAAGQFGSTDNRPIVTSDEVIFDTGNGGGSTVAGLRSPLSTYLPRYKVWKCPEDPSAVWAGSRRLRLRSYSMNGSFGSGEWLDGGPNPQQTRWQTFKKTADVAKTDLIFLFADEHPSSINDSALGVVASGASDSSQSRVIDFPSNRHAKGGMFVFTDGHGEYRRWRSSLIADAPFKEGVMMNLNVPAPGATEDTSWLAERATLPRVR